MDATYLRSITDVCLSSSYSEKSSFLAKIQTQGTDLWEISSTAFWVGTCLLQKRKRCFMIRKYTFSLSRKVIRLNQRLREIICARGEGEFDNFRIYHTDTLQTNKKIPHFLDLPSGYLHLAELIDSEYGLRELPLVARPLFGFDVGKHSFLCHITITYPKKRCSVSVTIFVS